jgi:hypothetical protein
MHNRRMERSAAYSGIVGALLFVLSGILPGAFPPPNATAADMSSYIGGHAAALSISAWLALPAVAFVLWFAFGLFDYLRSPDNADRTLAQWGAAGAIVWAALILAAETLQVAAVIRSPGTSELLPTIYAFDITLFVFGMGAFAAFAFAAANESRRKNATPGWLNALGYLTFAVDVLYSLTVLAGDGNFGITGIGAYVAPLLSMLWVLLASIVLLVSVPKNA